MTASTKADCGFCEGTGMDHGYGERPCHWCGGDARVLPERPPDHRHVWVPGDDGFRRGEVCVYCGAWRGRGGGDA